MLSEIRLHGTGGQGVVVAGEIMAMAASYEGRFCRAFPMYGPARRGAPVVAFVQMGDEDEATRSMVQRPGYIMVLDPRLPEVTDVAQGLLDGGAVVYNTPRPPEEAVTLFRKRISKIGVVDAGAAALMILGRNIPNTVMLGAFVRTTGLLGLGSVESAIARRFEGALAERNIEAARAGHGSAEVREVRG